MRDPRSFGLPAAAGLALSIGLSSLSGPVVAQEAAKPQRPVSDDDLAAGNIDVAGEPVHDDYFRTTIQIDRFEYQSREGNPTYLWDGFGYAGGDYNKLWIQSEGEGRLDGPLESNELQVLYSRAIFPYWDLQVGARYDFRSEPSKWYGVLGLEGLDFYYFQSEADIYVSEDGDFSSNLQVEFDELITQRLILQPRAEINLQAQDVDDLNLGAGITDYELGLRLRYEIRREVAPYIGVAWKQTVGETANRLPDGEDPRSLSFVAGLRLWF